MNAILSQDPSVRRQYGGVCAPYELPLRIRRCPYLFVVNTDKKGQPGALLSETRTLRVFHSLGRAPDFYHGRFKTVLKRNGPRYVYNGLRLQPSGTTTCGLYCVYYAKLRCRGWTKNKIVSSLKKTHFPS